MQTAMTAAEKCQSNIQAIIDGRDISPANAHRIFLAAMNLSMSSREAERCAFFLAHGFETSLPPELGDASVLEKNLRDYLREVQCFLKVIGGILNGQH